MPNQLELWPGLLDDPWQEYESPWRDEAFLDVLREFIEIGVDKGVFTESPFQSSWGIAFPNFIIEGYSWVDDYEQPFNFRYFPSGYSLSWYKHVGRGRTCNMDLTDAEYMRMVEVCLRDVSCAIEREGWADEHVKEGWRLAEECIEKEGENG